MTAARQAGRITVAGLAGGCGTSTVTLALGALLAWAGRRVLVAGDDDLLRLCGHGPWQGPGTAELAALGQADAAAEVAALARAVPGVPQLSVLGGGGMAVRDTRGWPVDVVLVDARASAPEQAGLLVARPDGCLSSAAGAPQPLLVIGRGPADPTRARRLLGRRPTAWLPEDPRIARAGLTGRVPADLPGRWLAQLRAALSR